MAPAAQRRQHCSVKSSSPPQLCFPIGSASPSTTNAATTSKKRSQPSKKRSPQHSKNRFAGLRPRSARLRPVDPGVHHLLIWDLRSPAPTKPVQSMVAHQGEVNCLAFNPFNEWVVATGSTDKTVKLFDLRKIDTSLHTFDCHKSVPVGVLIRACLTEQWDMALSCWSPRLG